MAKVFVTGGTGFIGSHLIDELLKKNYEVKALIRPKSSTKWLKECLELGVLNLEGSCLTVSYARSLLEMVSVANLAP